MAGARTGREPGDDGDETAEQVMPVDLRSSRLSPDVGPPTQRPRMPVTERARAAAESSAPEPRRRRDGPRKPRATRGQDRKARDRDQPAGDPATMELDRIDGAGPVPDPRVINERTVPLRTAVPPERPVVSRRTRLKIFLRDLDRRVLPPAAGLLTRFARSGLRGRRIGIALIAVAIVIAVLLAVYTASRPQPPIHRTVPVVSVGVRPDDSIQKYMKDSEARLRAMIADPRATAGVYALVSFDDYLDPTQVTKLLDGVKVAEVFMRAHLTAESAKVVQAPANNLPEDLDKAMNAQANSYATIADDLGTLIDLASGDTADDVALRKRYEAARTLAEAEAAAYRSLCPCVFAAVVFAPPATLGQLIQRRHVRVVDAFNRDQAPDPSTYDPPVPEQSGIASPPPIEDNTSP